MQCLSEAYGASAASAARRVRASKAHMLRLLPRESERSGAQAPHAQATSTSEGQGWHVGARPCTEGGRLLARAVPFRNACSESDQRGAARARIKRACCASSQQRVSAVARYTRYTRKPPHQVRARAGTWEHGLAPKKGGFSLVQCHSIAHGANATSVARRARATSARAGPHPTREQAQWRTSTSALHAQTTPRSAGQSLHVGARPCTEERRLLACAAPLQSARSKCRQRGAARTRVGGAHAAPPSQRERAQWRACALHAQATSPSEGQGWHMGARPCTTEGRILARAVPFHSARSDCHQRGAARALNKRACWASS